MNTIIGMLGLFISSMTCAQSVECRFDTPNYSNGPLNGQNGWVATADPGAAAVVSQPRRAGNQAARFDMNYASYDVSAVFPCEVHLAVDESIIDADWDFYYQFGDGFGWTIQIYSLDNRRLFWLWIDGGNMWFKTTGAEPTLVGAYLNERSWGHFHAVFDWVQYRTLLYIDGRQSASASFSPATARGVARFELQSLMGGYTDICGLDEIVISPRRVCHSDFNGDGAVDFFDYLDFVDAFAGMLPVADFNHDGVIDFFDYLDFVDAFSRGC